MSSVPPTPHRQPSVHEVAFQVYVMLMMRMGCGRCHYWTIDWRFDHPGR